MRKSILCAVTSLALSGCLATKDDIRLLQDDLVVSRTQAAQQAQAQAAAAAQAEAAHHAQMDSVVAALQRANDSIRTLSARLANFQAATNGTLYDVGQQLVTIQERTGLSQRGLQELRARMEERNEAAGAAVAKPGDTTKAVGPGADELFSIAKGQLDGGGYSTARSTFQNLLQMYPNYDGNAAALVYIGQSYEGEGSTMAADSVYQLVVTQYPSKPQAPTALFKLGNSLAKQGKVVDARTAYQRVISAYPKSDEANLAKGRLAALPSK